MKKNFFGNVILNIMAAGLLAVATQLIIFPYLSRHMLSENFGIAVTLYGFNQLLTVVVGNSINNIRLIYNEKVKNAGNFNRLLLIGTLIVLCMSIVLNVLYSDNYTVVHFIILAVWAVLSSLRAYLTIYYRIYLNYKNVLLVHLVMIAGFFMGIYIYKIVDFWGIVFLSGELIAVIYLLLTTSFIKEGYKSDSDYSFLVKETRNLIGSNLLIQSMNYLDRFLITPILGTNPMSVYYSVNIFSKLISMIVNPFNNVILSYLHKISGQFKRIFLLYNLGAVLLLIPGYFLMTITTPFLLTVFYPDFAKVNPLLIYLITGAALLNLLSTVINPFILKFKPMKYQMNVQIIFSLLYLTSALILSSSYGLVGFATASCVSYFCKWIMLFYIGMCK